MKSERYSMHSADNNNQPPAKVALHPIRDRPDLVRLIVQIPGLTVRSGKVIPWPMGSGDLEYGEALLKMFKGTSGSRYALREKVDGLRQAWAVNMKAFGGQKSKLDTTLSTKHPVVLHLRKQFRVDWFNMTACHVRVWPRNGTATLYMPPFAEIQPYVAKNPTESVDTPAPLRVVDPPAPLPVSEIAPIKQSELPLDSSDIMPDRETRYTVPAATHLIRLAVEAYRLHGCTDVMARAAFEEVLEEAP